MSNDSLPVDVQVRLEEVCVRFEAAWKAAETAAPRVEDYVNDAAGHEFGEPAELPALGVPAGGLLSCAGLLCGLRIDPFQGQSRRCPDPGVGILHCCD